MKIKQKIILFFIFLSITPIVIIGYLSYVNNKITIKEHSLDALELVVDAIVSDVLHMQEHRVKQANELVEGFFPNQLKSNGENNAATLEKIQASVDAVFSQLKVPFEHNGDEIHQLTAVDEINVIDNKGVVVVSTNKEMIGVEIPASYLEKEEVFFSGFNENSVFGKDNLIIVHQIKDPEDGKFSGALIVKIKHEIINLIISRHNRNTESGEVLIGVKNGNQVNFITHLRHTDTSPVIQIGSTRARPIQEAVKGWFGRAVSVDYRNKEVLSVWKYIPELDWGIVGKIDADEAFISVYEQRNNLFIISLVVLILGLFMTYYFSKSISNPIEQLVIAFHKMSKGELPETIDFNRKDEFGNLAYSFNKITNSTKVLAYAAEQIGEGNYDVDINIRSDNDILGNVISKLKQYMIEFNIQHNEIVNAAKEIRIQNSQKAGIIKSIDNHLVLVDINGIVLDTSDSLDAMELNTCFNQLLKVEKGSNYFEMIKELDAQPNSMFPQLHEALLNVLSGKEKKYSVEYMCSCDAKNEWFSLFITPFGKNEGLVISNKNITARVSGLETIRQSQERLKNIVDNIAEAIFSVDIDFRIITWNKSSERVYGYTEKEALGKEMNELLQTDFIHSNVNQVNEALNKSKIWKGEIIQTHKKGNNIFIEATYTHFENQKGVKEGYVILNRNNTQNRQYEVELTNALLEGEEIERKRIATNLHDGLGQYLSALRMHIQVIKEDIEAENYDDILSLIDTGIKEYRAVSHNLIPPILKEDGLSMAIKYMCDKLTHSGKIKVVFESNLDDLRIDSKIEIELYRITQELINNVLKHAFAQTIKVEILLTKLNILCIEVNDDGKGFDVEKSKISKKSGIGIKNIISRVYLLKGKISINSEIGKGSIILIKLKL